MNTHSHHTHTQAYEKFLNTKLIRETLQFCFIWFQLQRANFMNVIESSRDLLELWDLCSMDPRFQSSEHCLGWVLCVTIYGHGSLDAICSLDMGKEGEQSGHLWQHPSTKRLIPRYVAIKYSTNFRFWASGQGRGETWKSTSCMLHSKTDKPVFGTNIPFV